MNKSRLTFDFILVVIAIGMIILLIQAQREDIDKFTEINNRISLINAQLMDLTSDLTANSERDIEQTKVLTLQNQVLMKHNKFIPTITAKLKEFTASPFFQERSDTGKGKGVKKE